MRRARWSDLIISLLVLTAAGCGSGASSTGAPATTIPSSKAATTAAAPDTGVVVDSPGAAPRTPLVLRLTAGATTRSAIVSKVTTSATLNGQTAPASALPGTRTVMEQRIDRVDADGTGHYTFSLLDASTVPTPDADPAAVKATNAAIQSLKGIRGTGAIDVHGKVKDVTFDTNSVSDPAFKGVFDSFGSQLGNLSARLPGEPVGTGARWTATSTATLAGLKMTTVNHYTLRSRTGDRYELDFTQEAVAAPGPADFPNLPAGAGASVTDFTLRSTGRVSGDVTSQIPTTSSTQGAGDGTFAVMAGSKQLTLVEHLTVDNSTSPA